MWGLSQLRGFGESGPLNSKKGAPNSKTYWKTAHTLIHRQADEQARFSTCQEGGRIIRELESGLIRKRKGLREAKKKRNEQIKTTDMNKTSLRH
eukprot:51392-Amphidinium_carterae.1